MPTRRYLLTISDIDGEIEHLDADDIAERLERDLNHTTEHDRVEVLLERCAD